MQPDPNWTAGRQNALLDKARFDKALPDEKQLGKTPFAEAPYGNAPLEKAVLNATPDEGLHQAFSRAARRRPDAAALVSSGRTVTYRELDRTADAWAAGLAAAGVRPGDRVPILLPRGPELVTALLAVLKAGAAYALLEPAWPAARLDEIISDLQAPLVVAAGGSGVAPELPVWSPPAGPVEAPAGFRPAAVAGSAPCCVFFTSGTTGRPKGVLTAHRAISRLFQPGGFARFTAGTVMPLAAPAPWDAFALELWSVLLAGGTSLIVDEPYLSAHSLRDGIARHGTDTVWLTSSLFNMIVDEDLDAFGGLGTVMIGGERLSPAHVGRFLRRHPDIALLNGYGPVESTIFATTHRITPADCELPTGIPLGRPVPGTSVHVLDGDRECAAGETGEICLAGTGLAAGYLGDPALTGAKFTEVPIGGEPVRLYRTGDLGAWGADGLLHFRGRADRQLKVRGHRIEPAEVEQQVLRLLPAVRSCRVLAGRDGSGAAAELLAFCVPVRPGDPLPDALPTLRAALVPHQRPARVVSVDAFPVTAQGKLDEQALLAMVPPAPAPLAQGPVDSDDDLVRLVAQTFGAVLGTPAVPVDAPFPQLGGSSLGAGRVCARLTASLHRPVPVSALYQHPTAVSLAGWLRRTQPAAAVPVPAGPDPGTVPLTPMQLVFLTRHLVDPSDLTSHCLATWVIEGELDRAALEAAIASVHERHEPLRAAYVADPRPAALLVDPPPPDLLVLDGQPSVEAAVLALRAELSDELDPAQGQVWRTALVPVGAGEVTVFGYVVHHIAFDGWSEAVLANDLASAYNGAEERDEPPSLATVHRDYALRLAHADLAAHPAAHHEYLATELADVPALRWPAGPPPAAPGGTRQFEVSLSAGAVDALAAETGVSRFVVLLWIYARSLAEVTGQLDFAVGVPVAQRYGAGLEQAVGCHINMLCIRLRDAALDGELAGLRATGRAVTRAFAAQDVPFVEVLQRVDAPRTGRPPLFQTLFGLQDNAAPRLDLTGLATTFVRQPYLALPLELHAELWPQPDGQLRLVVSFQPDAVPESVAHEFAKRFADLVHTAPSGARP